MKKIFLFIITLLLIPLTSNAVVNDYNLSTEIGGFSGLNFNSPIMIIINVSAAIIMVFTIINLMIGYTRWKYLAAGNVDEMKHARETLDKALVGFIILVVVLMIDLLAK